MNNSLIIRRHEIETTLFGVFRGIHLGTIEAFDVIDIPDYHKVWQCAGKLLGFEITLHPRLFGIDRVGPWDAEKVTKKYEKVYVLNRGKGSSGLSQALALARKVGKNVYIWDVSTNDIYVANEKDDCEKIDTMCQYLPPTKYAYDNYSEMMRVIRPDLLGDIFFTIPLLYDLKRLFPKKKLSLVVNSDLVSIAKKIKIVDTVECLSIRDFGQFQKDIERVSLVNAEYQFLPLGAGHRPELASYINRVLPAKIKIGRLQYDRSVDYSYNNLIPYSEMLKVRALSLIAKKPELFSFIKRQPYESMMDELERNFLSYKIDNVFEINFNKSLPALNKNDIVCVLAGSTHERDWTKKGWLDIFRYLLSEITGRLILLGSNDKYQIESNYQIAKHLNAERVIDLTGKTSLADIIQLSESAGGYLGINTSIMHLFCLQGKPTVSLNSPIESASTWQYPFKNHKIIQGKRLMYCTWTTNLDKTLCKIKQRAESIDDNSYFYNTDSIISVCEEVFVGM